MGSLCSWVCVYVRGKLPYMQYLAEIGEGRGGHILAAPWGTIDWMDSQL